MVSIPAQHVIAVLTVALQFFVLSTDNLAGLSGADSIVRACISSLDSSIGLILLEAIYTFVFEPPRDSRFRLKRLSLLHSQKEDLKQEIRLKIRPSWSRPFTNVTRIAVLSSASNGHTDHELQNSSVTFTRLEVMENLCQFVVPYMGRPKPLVPTTHTVQLSGSVLMDAAAKSFARYSMFVAWSGSIHLVRTFFLLHYTSNPGLKVLFLVSEISRFLVVLFQESTVMTYTNQFKGITTFARTHPYDGPDVDSRTRPSWAAEPQKQSDFERTVLGYQYRLFPLTLPAIITMGVASIIWPVGNKTIKLINKALGRLSPDLLPDIGERMFSRWAMPSEPEFTSGTLLRLQIFEGDSTKDELPAYTIIFKDVPELLLTEMRSPYMPREKLERWTWMLILTIGTTGVFAPAAFALLHPHAGLQTYWLIEQFLVTVMKYGDVSNLLINTTFDGETLLEWPGASGI